MSKLDQLREMREAQAHPVRRALKKLTAPKINLAAQVRALGADSLLPDWKPPRKGRPLNKDRATALAATKPWLAAGMSRATWFRRQRGKS